MSHQSGHARIAQRYPAACVLQRRPDRMVDTRFLRGAGHRQRLIELFRGRVVRPEERHTKHRVRAVEGLSHAVEVVQIRLNDFRSRPGKILGLRRFEIPRDRADNEILRLIAKDRADEPASLRACRTHDRDDFSTGVAAAHGVTLHAARGLEQPRETRVGRLQARC